MSEETKAGSAPSKADLEAQKLKVFLCLVVDCELNIDFHRKSNKIYFTMVDLLFVAIVSNFLVFMTRLGRAREERG